MAEGEQDSSFSALPARLQRRIDAAFDTALGEHDPASVEPARKRRKLEHSGQAGGFISHDTEPGGFIIDDPTTAGGFVIDEPLEGGFVEDRSPTDDASDTEPRSHLPLSLISTALQILDLPPDDEDILSVFRNAASGWGEQRRSERRPGQQRSEEALVSRKDWRAVCAALLDGGAADGEDVDVGDEAPAAQADNPDGGLEETPSDSGEDYVDSGDGGSDVEEAEDSDDDYRAGGFTRSKRANTKSNKARPGTSAETPKARKARRATESDRDEGTRGELTSRQKEECRAAFALFFPGVADEELDQQRIRIKDVTRVAELLREKITAEETVEMLETFSTAPDKSMGLAEFERMMIAAKLA
ncbi:hypothetical protein BD414DRAFT_424250 [Trametes punicea]|nr:hypothetical protein BD414DRAFT_424250 [Trametes punicea]